MEDWDIAPLAANHWNRAIVVPPIFDPYTRAPKRRGKLECGGKRGTGSEKKQRTCFATDLCVLPILMKPLRTPKSEDTINEYCYEHFKGDFECTLAEGKGRRHC